MAQFRVTAPDGTVYNVTGPDGATEQDAIAQAMQMHAGAGGSGGSDTMASDPYASSMPLPKGMLIDAALNKPHAPLTVANAASAVGNLALGVGGGTLGIPGDVETLARAGLSRLTPSVSPQNVIPNSTDIENAIGGTPEAGSDAGAERFIGGLLSPFAASRVGLASKAAVAGKTDNLTQAASDANAAGYVIPPNMASSSPSLVSQMLNGVAGKIKTQQLASVKNAETTNALAARAVGLPEDQPVTEAALEGVRRDAGQSYNAVRQAPIQVIPDQQFATDVSALDQRGAAARAEVPGLVSNPALDDLTTNLGGITQLSPDATVDAIRSLRYKAQQNLKAYGSPEQRELGMAQSGAATALEGLLERNLVAATTARAPIGAQGGDMTGLVNDLQNARATIAKTYDIQDALNPVTGNVDAQRLATLQARGKPLTGPLKQAADMATAFPKAVQNPAKFGGNENVSVLDNAGALGAAALGRPEYLGWLLARPVARHLILSDAYQSRMIPELAAPAAGAANSANVLNAPVIATNPILRALVAQRILSAALAGMMPNQSP